MLFHLADRAQHDLVARPDEMIGRRHGDPFGRFALWDTDVFNSCDFYPGQGQAFGHFLGTNRNVNVVFQPRQRNTHSVNYSCLPCCASITACIMTRLAITLAVSVRYWALPNPLSIWLCNVLTSRAL